MRDILATHRDVGLLGIRHRSWMVFLAVLVAVQFIFLVMRGGGSDPLEGSLESYVKSVKTRRVAVVMPLHSDQTKVLKRRFKTWNMRRFPCANRREHHMTDMVFYVGPNANINLPVIETHFSQTEARKCFRNVRIVRAAALPAGSAESEEAHAFYRAFDHHELTTSYDVFFYMSPNVWQVKSNWADKVYEEAVLSDTFWVKGSAAMQTCPKSALTPEGDCDGSINTAFPAVIHININALYSFGDREFDGLRTRAEKKYPGIGPDVAMFKELVSTDHPLTSKLSRGAQRKTLSVNVHQFRHHDDDPALSGARSKSTHLTSLYWPAHAHRYRYTDFIVNAMAGKQHFKEDLKKGLHPNTYLVHQGLSE